MGFLLRFCLINYVGCVSTKFLLHGVVRKNSRKRILYHFHSFKKITERDKATTIRRRFIKSTRVCAAIVKKGKKAKICFIRKVYKKKKFEILCCLVIPSKYVKYISQQYLIGAEIKKHFKKWIVRQSLAFQFQLRKDQERENKTDNIQFITGRFKPNKNLNEINTQTSETLENEIIVIEDSEDETPQMLESTKPKPQKKPPKNPPKVHIAPEVCHIQCDKCGNKYRTLRNLRIHMNVHQRLYVCKICGKRCQGVTALKEHRWMHVSVNNLECQLCKRKFKYDKSLKVHYNSVHNEKSLYSCDLCNQEFKTSFQLSQHKRFVHVGLRNHHHHKMERTLRCETCNNSYSSLDSLRNHKYLKHSILKRFPCPVDLCNSAFKIKNHMLKHYNMFHNDKRYICDKCGKTYKLRQSIIDHFRFHAEKDKNRRYSCRFCTKYFILRSSYNSHIRRCEFPPEKKPRKNAAKPKPPKKIKPQPSMSLIPNNVHHGYQTRNYTFQLNN